MKTFGRKKSENLQPTKRRRKEMLRRTTSDWNTASSNTSEEIHPTRETWRRRRE
jgi:hypothetical protein